MLLPFMTVRQGWRDFAVCESCATESEDLVYALDASEISFGAHRVDIRNTGDKQLLISEVRLDVSYAGRCV